MTVRKITTATKSCAAPPRVCAVVLTRDRWALLEQCLQALLRQTRAPDEILVVDNASSDGTPERVAAQFPSVLLRALPTNRGAAGGFRGGLVGGDARGHAGAGGLGDGPIAHPDAPRRRRGRGGPGPPP